MSSPAIPTGPASLVIKIVVLALAIAFIREQSAQLPELSFASGDLTHNSLAIFSFWLGLLAPGWYLCALWAASDVFASLNKGKAFGPAFVKGIKSVGAWLMAGAATAIVIVPSVGTWISDRFRGFRYDTDIESVTIFLVGLVLYVLARQGQALKAELEQFV